MLVTYKPKAGCTVVDVLSGKQTIHASATKGFSERHLLGLANLHLQRRSVALQNPPYPTTRRSSSPRYPNTVFVFRLSRTTPHKDGKVGFRTGNRYPANTRLEV
jgi:hypothetical protein